MKCPIGIPGLLRLCEACDFGKDAERDDDKCDYPYSRGMTVNEIKAMAERQKDAR